ncbi:hypothetical protein BLNAU_14457 [Blattamonas nauphoetae]|uniref:Uncharacterized protein n=1 Tax=Blattamonas nauphoetae TaxID=2049346 RepID=A0ABQ9XH70_9EUKA|nr:hypothetical protein BLNAU_14457 [Blattamonas nauphoetae]
MRSHPFPIVHPSPLKSLLPMSRRLILFPQLALIHLNIDPQNDVNHWFSHVTTSWSSVPSSAGVFEVSGHVRAAVSFGVKQAAEELARQYPQTFYS